MSIKASVVIPSIGRLGRLQDCVQSVISQKTSFPFEVIVVIDGPESEKMKSELEKRFGRLTRLIVDTSLSRRGSPGAKNVGLRISRGEIVVFVDDDTVAEEGWLETIIKSYVPGVVGVGGSERKMHGSGIIRRAFLAVAGNPTGVVTRYGLVLSNFTPDKTKSEYVDCLAGCNMSFRRDCLREVGGFDAGFQGTAYREETDLCVRISRHGKLLFVPASVVNHHEETVGGNSPDSLQSWDYWYHRNNTYFYLRNIGKPMGFHWCVHLLVELVVALWRAVAQRSMLPIATMSKGIHDGKQEALIRTNKIEE